MQTQHSASAKEHHPYCEAWWWQHHVLGMFLISRVLGTCQDRRENGLSKILEDNMLTSARKLKLGRKFTFQHDDDPTTTEEWENIA